MMYENLLDAIGNTPLIRVDLGHPTNIYAKLEYFNPGGSVKDRSARYMIEEAEQAGKLKPGGTIIEGSSGNQGIATAMIGAAKGYNVIITVAEKVSKEKKDTLRAYGAEVIVCPTRDDLRDPDSYHAKAVEIQKNTPNSFMINQYFNPDNIKAHYNSMGKELWRQTNGKITHLVGAIGSCGTICGAGKYLKEQNPDIKIIGVDSPNSYRSTGGCPGHYAVEGMGVDTDSPLIDYNTLEDVLLCADQDAFDMLKVLAHQQGFLVGPAGGAAAWGAQQYAKNLGPDDLMVVIFGDSGRAYLTKNLYN